MSFQIPRKAILTPEQLSFFKDSKTYRDIVGFIEGLNEDVVSVKLTDECEQSPVCEYTHSASYSTEDKIITGNFRYAEYTCQG